MTLDTVKSVVARRIFDLRSSVEFDTFLASMEELGEVAIVGGGPRDWFVGRSPRDLDFVVRTSPGRLHDVVDSHLVRRNRYGGCKLAIGDMAVDVWCLDATWAFTHSKKFSPTLSDLPHTAFYNLDAITVSLTTGSVYDGGFEKALRDRELSVVFAANPFPELCAARGLSLAKHYGLRLGRSVVEYFDSLVTFGTSWKQIDTAQCDHYGVPRVTVADLNELLPSAIVSQLVRQQNRKHLHVTRR